MLPPAVAQNVDLVKGGKHPVVKEMLPTSGNKIAIIRRVARWGNKVVISAVQVPHRVCIKLVEHDNEILIECTLDQDLSEILDYHHHILTSFNDE